MADELLCTSFAKRGPMAVEYTLRSHFPLRSEAERLTLPLPKLMEALQVQDAEHVLLKPVTVAEASPGSFVRLGSPESRRPPRPVPCPTGTFHPAEAGLSIAAGAVVRPILSGAKDRTEFDLIEISARGEATLPARKTDRRFVVVSGRGHASLGGVDAELSPGDVLRLRRSDELKLCAGGEGGGLRLLMISTPRLGRMKQSHVVKLDESRSFYKQVEGCEINQVANDPRDSAVSIVRARVGVGSRTSPHVVLVNERYFIAKGTGVAELGWSKHPVGPGDLVSIPHGARQLIRNSGTEPLEFYAICTNAFRKADYYEVE